MKYLCIVYIDPEIFGALSPQGLAALDEASLAFDEELHQTGQLILAQALQPIETATTIRVRDGRLSATDGPFAETTEHLGGFMYVEARDLNEAIEIAGRSPIAPFGSIEIRPVHDLARAVQERRKLAAPASGA
jgi:hypothetical protein